MNNLRKQRIGKQHPWTKDELRAGLEAFKKEYGRYPTGPEVDRYEYLPSARSIERSHGGLKALRTSLGLDGQIDFRTGEHSTLRAHTINKRAHKNESVVYEYLITNFGKQFVHREFFFTDDRRTRSDFFVYDTQNGFCVDVFFAENKRNLAGCLNTKLNKYQYLNTGSYPVIFLQMNPELPQSILDEITNAKKRTKKLGKQQQLMDWGTFVNFCETRSAVRISKSK